MVGDWLLFGTGGWGWADTRFSADAACLTTGSFPCGPSGPHAPISVDRTKNGAVFGGGFEYHLPSTSWIVGAEYLRYQFNGSSESGVTRDIATGAPLSTGACPAGTACVNYNAGSLRLNEVRVRASYQFGGLAVARY